MTRKRPGKGPVYAINFLFFLKANYVLCVPENRSVGHRRKRSAEGGRAGLARGTIGERPGLRGDAGPRRGRAIRFCVVHGNGPQVGNLLIQQESASNQIPPYNLDIAVA